METIFMKNENSKMNQLHKFVLNLSQRLDLRSLRNNDTLQKFINLLHVEKYKYQKNKLKIIAPTWNDEFELPGYSYSVSNFQDYTKYIIKNMKSIKMEKRRIKT